MGASNSITQHKGFYILSLIRGVSSGVFLFQKNVSGTRSGVPYHKFMEKISKKRL